MMEVCFQTLGLPPSQNIPLGNENYSSMASDTKNTVRSIFSLADDVFPFSQYCVKPNSKKNLTREFFLITVSLEREVSLKM